MNQEILHGNYTFTGHYWASLNRQSEEKAFQRGRNGERQEGKDQGYGVLIPKTLNSVFRNFFGETVENR